MKAIKNKMKEKNINNKSIILFFDVLSQDDALKEIHKAFVSGIDGLFITNNHIPFDELLLFYRNLRLRYPDKWIGLKLNDIMAHEIFEIFPMDANGFWIGTIEQFNGQIEIPNSHNIFDLKLLKKWKGLIFGELKMSVFDDTTRFSYNMRIARNFVDVVVTKPVNNPQTTIKFFQNIDKDIIPNNLGIKISNIEDLNFLLYSAFANYLVLTDNEKAFCEINPLQVKEFINLIKRQEKYDIKKTKYN